MNAAKIIDSLERFGRLLPELVRGVPDADCRWKPSDGAWSILEIVSHLADEEAFDFGYRIKHLLTTPEEPWPPIDPVGWAVQHDYNRGDLAEATERFGGLRGESVAWLRAQASPDWNLTYQHAEFGPLRAGDLLGSWSAHDCLHLRQVSKRLYQLAERDAGGYSVRYAGDW